MTDLDRHTLLTDAEVDAQLGDDPQLGGWVRDGAHLRRSFRFADFVEAFGFMARVALVAERLFHHPEWSNVYDQVDVAVTNHDAGGLTELDLEFARRVGRVAS